MKEVKMVAITKKQNRKKMSHNRVMLVFTMMFLSFSLIVTGIILNSLSTNANPSPTEAINMELVTSTAIVNQHTEFQINTPAGLAMFSIRVNGGASFQDRTVFLTSDIVLTGTNNHVSIGTTTNPFRGHFDGQGFTISEIDISGSFGAIPVGFFGHVAGIATNRASVRDLTVAGNIEITGAVGSSIAGIAGQANYTDIINCVNRINITNTITTSGHIMIAGIVVNSVSTNVINCINHGTLTVISPTADMGGIIAASNSAVVINSVNFGSIISPTPLRSIGGVYGALTVSNIINSVNLGVIPNAVEARVNGIGTTNADMTTTVRNSFSVQVIPDHAVYGRVSNNVVVNSRGGIPLDASGSGDTASALSDDFLATLNNNANLLRMGQFPGLIGQTFPDLTNWEHTPQLINEVPHLTVPTPNITVERVGVELRTEGDVIAFRNAVNGGISFAGQTVRVVNDIALIENHVPIGTGANPFRGHFDGQGFTISGMNISNSSIATAGFFGTVIGTQTQNASIRNLTVEGVMTSASVTIGMVSAWGGIVGNAEHVTLANLISMVDITLNFTTPSVATSCWIYGGGIVGIMRGGVGINLFNHGTITSPSVAAAGYMIGGIVAVFSNVIPTPLANTDAFLINAVNFGEIVTRVIPTHWGQVGGLIGYYSTSTAGLTRANIINSVNFGVLPNTARASGLFGMLQHPHGLARNVYSALINDDASYARGVVHVEGANVVTQVENLSPNRFVPLNATNATPTTDAAAPFGAMSQSFLNLLNSNAAMLRAGTFPGVTTAFPEISNWVHTTQTINGNVTNNVPSISFAGTYDITTETTGNGTVTHAGGDLTGIEEGETRTFTANPTTGHRFVRWDITGVDGLTTSTTNPITITMGDENVTITAVFEPIPSTITFNNVQDTTNSNPTTFNVETPEITLQPLPHRTAEGWNFVQWRLNNASGNPITQIDTSAVGNITLWAEWTAIGYSITYNLDGGTNHASNPSTFTVNDIPLTLQDPSRDGYTFGGWFDASVGGNQVTNITTIGNATLWARWNIVTYNITYTLGANTTNSGNPSTFTINDLPLQLQDATRSGYTFVAWYLNGARVTHITEIGHTTLVAYFGTQANTYDITFNNLHNGTHLNQSTFNIHQVTPHLTLLDATRDGFNFLGWFDELVGGTRVTQLTTADLGDTVVLYARWSTAITYNISFDNLGGAASNNQTTFTVEDLPRTLNNPASRDGWTFVEWRLHNVYGVPVTQLSTTGNITLWAVWSANPYTITFNNVLSIEHSNDTGFTIETQRSLTPASRNGWTFDGWFTALTGGTQVTQITAGTFGNQTLYANWTLTTFTITYENLGTATHTSPTTFTIETSTFTLSNPTERTGWTFVGWFDALTGGTQITEITVGTFGNQTIYARWNPINVLVTFDTGFYGSHIPPQEIQVHYGRVPTLTPTRTDYRFVGWSIHAEDYIGERTLFDITSTAITTPITLFAVWEVYTPSPSLNFLHLLLIGGGSLLALLALALLIFFLRRREKEEEKEAEPKRLG